MHATRTTTTHYGGSNAVVETNLTANTLIVRPLMGAARRHPLVTALWAVGLAILLFATGFKLSERQERDFTLALQNIDFASLEDSQFQMDLSYQIYYESKGWFFRCDPICNRNYAEYQLKQKIYENLKAQAEEKLSQAKSHLGIFSEVGVEQARGMLYAKVHSGKEFAKRATIWDALFAGIGSMARDEGLAQYFFRIILHAIFNLFIGLVGACTSFLWGVYWLITSFRPTFFEGILFFAGCVAVVVSIIVSFGLGVYVTGASALLGATTLSIANRQQHRDPRYIR